MNPKRGSKTHEIALSGLLFALAMALSFVEGTLVIPGLMPGMKLGLANIVVMYALFFMGGKQALVLDLLKALFVFLVSGWTAGFLSLCGGLFSLLVMWVLYDHFPVQPTWFILSVCGALAHNVGQLLGASVILSSAMSLYYAPVMLVFGLIIHHPAGPAARPGPPGLQHPRKARLSAPRLQAEPLSAIIRSTSVTQQENCPHDDAHLPGQLGGFAICLKK